MIFLIAGSSHTGKTLLAQKLLEQYNYPYLSIDHLKMGLIRSGQTSLTPEDDDKLTDYLWPIVREMIKTAIENKQNLIVEGCYIPYDYKKDFTEDYLVHIKYICLIFSQNYIEEHYETIMCYGNAIEKRLNDVYPKNLMLEDNKNVLEACKKYGCDYKLIDKGYIVDLDRDNIMPNESPRFRRITQRDFEKNSVGKSLHILNGSCMLEAFKQNGTMCKGDSYMPFNEAMCWGKSDTEIFSQTFIKRRAKSLKSTEDDYRKIVLEPLKPLFDKKFGRIVMWFGEDMFCQINMMTMMAYLDQIHYDGNVLLCIVKEEKNEFSPKIYEVSIEGAWEKYKMLVCQQQMPNQGLLSITWQMAKLYLEYHHATSEINQYIMKHCHKEKWILVNELIQKFPQYGLGDLQYEMMIEEILQIEK